MAGATAAAATLRTERLVLAPVDDTDVDPLCALLGREPVYRYLLDGEPAGRDWMATVVADSRTDFARRGLGFWTVREPEGPDPDAAVGLVGFRDFYDPPCEEVLYALRDDRWGRGLATEMARAAIDHAFDLGRDVVRAGADVPNTASQAVLARLGFRETHRDHPPGCRWEQIHYALPRAAWKAGAP